ncbi:MAG TPA: Hsp20 family protein [Acidimicrobiales bacterium]|jgi:HSP20 family molecular chaperone IbpA|nr:Hsp20 family protein [Acidimicrobiales bacterium]
MATDQDRQSEVAEATRATEETMRPQTVPVNVYETDGAMVVVAPLPAVQPGDVNIDLWPGKLRITAHVRSAPPRDYLVHEWDYGGYERELEVPTGFGAGVEASLANGQLAVRVLRGHSNDKISVRPGPHPN